MNNVIEQKQWMVIYTRPKWEKKIVDDLKQANIECYCPVRKVRRKWADRIKEIAVPLFSCYIFVHVDLKTFSKVLAISGVLGYVYFMGKPAVVRDKIIEELKLNLHKYHEAEIVDLRSLSPGERICISKGIFVEQEGRILSLQGKTVLVVLDNMQCALVARIPAEDILKTTSTSYHGDIQKQA